VYLDAYYIYKYEVTNGQFAKFMNETGYKTEAEKEGYSLEFEGGKVIKKQGIYWGSYYSSGTERHPVTHVSWNDASAYCKWAGGTIPTEAQWEKASRGIDGRRYPWGNEWDDAKCNWFRGAQLSGLTDILEGRGTLPVGSFPSGASPYGCLDLTGNVWEWCSDWYGENYYKNSPSKNPMGPSSREYRVARGGSWANDDTVDLRSALRGKVRPHLRYANHGFRVCHPSNSQ